MRKNIISMLFLGAALTFSSTALAQKKKPKLTVRFLAAGEAPPLKIVERGGQRYEAEPPAGSIPPRVIHIPTSEGQSSAVRLALGRISSPVTIHLDKSHTIKLNHEQQAEDEKTAANLWTKAKLAPYPRSLVLLMKKPKDKNWDHPVSICLRDDAQHFPAGAIRLINASALPIFAVVDKKKITISPGKNFISRKKNRKQDVALYVKNNRGKFIRVFQSELDNSGSRRTNLLLYTAKPRRRGKAPVAVRLMPETTPTTAKTTQPS